MQLNKFCFITPPTTRPQDDIFFPMGPVVLGTILKDHGIPVEILDFDLLSRQHPQFMGDYPAFEKYYLEKVAATQADVFGISSICSNFPNALHMAMKLRENFPQAKIILGGPQPSSVPEKTLEKFPFIDAIVIGEGEKTLLELLEVEWEAEALKKVTGIAFRMDDKIYRNPARALIEDLDELPIPDFSLVPLRDYLKLTPHTAVVEAGRGCPFRCSFCSTAGFWSRKYRAKSPARILEEMGRLNRDFGMDYFCLTHDNFTTSPQYVRKFCHYLVENNQQKLTWSCSARTDTLKIPDIKLLYQAGCRQLFYGVDSGSPQTQKAIEKYLNLDSFKKIMKETVRFGIHPIASFVIGFPEEGPGDLDETILLGLWAKQVGACEVQFHRLSPLANTKIFNENKSHLKFNWLVNDMSLLSLRNEEMLKWVQEDPELFSSFYYLPTKKLDPLDLFDFSSFYNAIANKYAPSIQWIFNKGRKKPIQLYEEWNRYSEDQYPDTTYFNGRRTRDFFEESFAEFV